MRAALYARVSTTGHGQDPEMQLRELREYCQRRGWESAGEFIDVGISLLHIVNFNPLIRRLPMQTRILILSVAVVLLLGFAPRAFAQLGTHLLSPHRTLGYFNSDTGLFEPLRPMAQDSEVPAAGTPTVGTLVFKFTITLKSALAKNAILFCSAQGAVIETSFSATEDGLGIATLESGDTYSCSVSMPYSWLLKTPSTDKIILSYKAETLEALQVTATNGTGISVTSTAGRVSSQTIASIPVPASGVTTTETVSITL